MKSLIITGICFCMLLGAYSQKRFGNSDGINKAEMNGAFAVQFSETGTKYFWAVDLSQLTTDQKGRFETLVFEDQKLVAISTPNEENIWYLSAYKTSNKEDLLLSLNKFREKALISAPTNNTKYN